MPRSRILAVVAISVVVACTSEKTETMPAPPPPGHVNMTLKCVDGGGLNFVVVPSKVRLPAPTAAFTWHNDPTSNVDGVISAQNPKYPFNGRKLIAPHNGVVVGKPVVGTPADTYKYSITVICPTSGTSMDTTIIDPDMIIPWHITQ